MWKMSDKKPNKPKKQLVVSYVPERSSRSAFVQHRTVSHTPPSADSGEYNTPSRHHRRGAIRIRRPVSLDSRRPMEQREHNSYVDTSSFTDLSPPSFAYRSPTPFAYRSPRSLAYHSPPSFAYDSSPSFAYHSPRSFAYHSPPSFTNHSPPSFTDLSPPSFTDYSPPLFADHSQPSFGNRSRPFADQSPSFTDQSPPFTDQSPSFTDQSPSFAYQSPPFTDQSPSFADQSPSFADQSPPFTDQSPSFADQSPPFSDQWSPFADQSPLSPPSPPSTTPVAVANRPFIDFGTVSEELLSTPVGPSAAETADADSQVLGYLSWPSDRDMDRSNVQVQLPNGMCEVCRKCRCVTCRRKCRFLRMNVFNHSIPTYGWARFVPCVTKNGPCQMCTNRAPPNTDWLQVVGPCSEQCNPDGSSVVARSTRRPSIKRQLCMLFCFCCPYSCVPGPPLKCIARCSENCSGNVFLRECRCVNWDAAVLIRIFKHQRSPGSSGKQSGCGFKIASMSTIWSLFWRCVSSSDAKGTTKNNTTKDTTTKNAIIENTTTKNTIIENITTKNTNTIAASVLATVLLPPPRQVIPIIEYCLRPKNIRKLLYNDTISLSLIVSHDNTNIAIALKTIVCDDQVVTLIPYSSGKHRCIITRSMILSKCKAGYYNAEILKVFLAAACYSFEYLQTFLIYK